MKPGNLNETHTSRNSSQGLGVLVSGPPGSSEASFTTTSSEDSRHSLASYFSFLKKKANSSVNRAADAKKEFSVSGDSDAHDASACCSTDEYKKTSATKEAKQIDVNKHSSRTSSLSSLAAAALRRVGLLRSAERPIRSSVQQGLLPAQPKTESSHYFSIEQESTVRPWSEPSLNQRSVRSHSSTSTTIFEVKVTKTKCCICLGVIGVIGLTVFAHMIAEAHHSGADIIDSSSSSLGDSSNLGVDATLYSSAGEKLNSNQLVVACLTLAGALYHNMPARPTFAQSDLSSTREAKFAAQDQHVSNHSKRNDLNFYSNF